MRVESTDLLEDRDWGLGSVNWVCDRVQVVGGSTGIKTFAINNIQLVWLNLDESVLVCIGSPSC